nr:hypothetical protein [uncultured Rhodoferax sp.]
MEQTMGDTLGIGGIMRCLRTIPVPLAMPRWHLAEGHPRQ